MTENHRIAYVNTDGEASEAIVTGRDADDAISRLEDYGHGASVTAVGPAADELQDDIDVNEGDADDLTLAEAREELDAYNVPTDTEAVPTDDVPHDAEANGQA